jgi:hypothetical protein
MDKDIKKRMISLEISDNLREQLRIEAFNRNVTISALIRQILEKEVGSKEIKHENLGQR